MKSQLKFTEITLSHADFGADSTVPDMLGTINVQNRTIFNLDETDEIYEGYGKLDTAYPYKQKCNYARDVKPCKIKAAVLENDSLKAVFLPQYGGRLWQLYDKKAKRDLLFTNDVLRPSNLAVRNAWFSGGVEWNVSVIGHTPFTSEPLFTAKTKLDDGTPVLRMYEYERIRGITYQMDFWLGENDYLSCRMRIENTLSHVVPMYWWSNIAVPETKGMRIAVAANSAYTGTKDSVYKTNVPLENGLDVTYPEKIPSIIDYFFDVDETAPKYIAAIEADGSALLQTSTNRLRGRKLFTWGHTDMSHRWQNFLNDTSRNYLEIQAGLGKTQYGCIPMPPHTAWEWLETYGAAHFAKSLLKLPHMQFIEKAAETAQKAIDTLQSENVLAATKNMAKAPAKLVYTASGYGAFAQLCREKSGERTLPSQLDFGKISDYEGFAPWQNLLEKDTLSIDTEKAAAAHYFADDIIFDKLKKACKRKNAAWAAHYHLALNYYLRGNYAHAETQLKKSLAKKDTALAHHAMAALMLKTKHDKKAARHALAALKINSLDVTLDIDAMRILCAAKAYKKAIAAYKKMPAEAQMASRIKFLYAEALYECEHCKAALAAMDENGGIMPADVREGEDKAEDLYNRIKAKTNGKHA